MGFNDFWISNNGKKEHLNNAKHGVRKEQVDKKFHNLFDAYDANGDGTLETEELSGIFKSLTKFAGADKTLDATENKKATNIFSNQAGIRNADFMGFVRSVSKASTNIVASKTTPTPDGGKEVSTTYKDGTVEIISYYPDGEYKFKKLDQKTKSTTYSYSIGYNMDKKYSEKQIESMIKNEYNKKVAKLKQQKIYTNIEFGLAITPTIPSYNDFKKEYMRSNNINKNSYTINVERHDFELSERGKADIAVRDFVLTHYIETHKAAQEALESMGILDNVGALINTGAGEIWNSIKNVWNGTKEEYQNFYELSKKFEPNYDKALRGSGSLDVMRTNPEMFFSRFEIDFKKDTGHSFDFQSASEFQQITERYQNAQILKQRIDILNEAMQEIRMFRSEQDAQTYAPVQSEGFIPGNHLDKANKLLLQYFDGDQYAVNMILNGTVSNLEATINSISGIKKDSEATLKVISKIKEDTEKLNASVLGGKTFEEIQNDYRSQYKAMYGTDFIPDELTDKVMNAKATGGMVKLATITIISILITRSPIMAEISGVAAGSAEATGVTTNLLRTLVAKYGQTTVQQGIQFAMTSGTLALDVGGELLNQLTDKRDGIQLDEIGEKGLSSAKYIFAGSYIGGPLAQAVSKTISKAGLASRLFEGGVKSGEAIQTTSITGNKLLQNFIKGGNKALATGGAFLTDVAVFSGLEVATEDVNLKDALSEQGQMLSKLKLMNLVLEYMLGAKAHTATSKAKLKVAIDKAGIKNWNIKEIKTQQKVQYIVDIDGIPVGRFKNVNELATAMLERITANYNESATPEVKTGSARPKTEVKTPDVKPKGAVKVSPEVESARLENQISIPAGKLEAPNVKFAETDEAFRTIVTKRSTEIKELDKIADIDEFCQKSFELIKEEMGLDDSGIKLQITDNDNFYDHETNTVYISRNWAGKEKGHVRGEGDKAEIFGGIAHELNHYLQWKEIVLNFDSENPNWNNIIEYLQKFEGAQKNIEYLIKKYPDNIELKEAFEKAKSYQDNWLNYVDAFDENGTLKTGAEYEKYKNQTVEAESFRRGNIVTEEYRKSVAKKQTTLSRLETETPDLAEVLLASAEVKVKKAWQQHDIKTPTSEEKINLFDLDLNADLKEPVPDAQNEVTTLILKNKLKETLNQRFKIENDKFNDILQAHKEEINVLAKEYANDNLSFSKEIIHILSKDFGLSEFEPTIQIVSDNELPGTGGFDFSDGTISIRESVKDKNEIVEIISHEFNHHLQYLNMVAQYGEQGIKELLTQNYDFKYNETLTEEMVAKTIDGYLNSDYNKKIVANFKPTNKEGTLNSYINNIYKDEMTNIATPGTPEYFVQLTELEAYHIGSKNGKNLEIKSPKPANNNDDLEIYSYYIQELIKRNSIDAKFDRVTGIKLPELSADLIKAIHNNVAEANFDRTTGLNIREQLIEYLKTNKFTQQKETLNEKHKTVLAGYTQMTDAEFVAQTRELCTRADGTESSTAKALLETLKNSGLSDSNISILENFKNISRDYRGNLLDEVKLAYAEEMLERIPKGKNPDLLIGTDSTISNIITIQLDYAKPEAKQQIIEATKKLLSNPYIGNVKIADIISSCTEGNIKEGYTFNQKVFDKIEKLFVKQNIDGYEQYLIKNCENFSDFKYSKMIAQIAKSAIRYDIDTNGNQIKYFDDIAFKIGMTLPESDFHRSYQEHDFMSNYSQTNEVDLHKISIIRDYITKKFDETFAQLENKTKSWVEEQGIKEIRDLCTINGELDVQNCFAVEYMKNDLNMSYSQIKKYLENNRNQNGILDIATLRAIQNDLNDKLATFNPVITVEQAKLQCNDDNLIALATTKDGKVQKYALDVAMKYKSFGNYHNYDVEFLLSQCNGNYKKVSELMDKIKSELDKLDLEVRYGEIGIKGLKTGQYPDMDFRQFQKKYGFTSEIFQKLIYGSYNIQNLMHFYLYDKSKFIDTFYSGNIMKDFDVAYGCRSITTLQCRNFLEKQSEIASLMAHSLSSKPTPDQRSALGQYKGDSGSIQDGHWPKEANDIDEYLSGNPLKKSIKVKREDSYAILSNLKFADGVTLKDAITNPQYYDRLSQIKSLEGQSFINDKFMSTTVGNGAFGNCYVNWDLEIEEGVGATYLDILGLASEAELLLNRGLKITIKEIDDTTPNGIVHIKAKVENPDYNK